jgi:ABC-2 type transport system permease protein
MNILTSKSPLDGPFMTLVRRELWEHRSLVWAPLVMALTIIVLSLVSGAVNGGMDIRLGDERPLSELLSDPDKQRGIFAVLLAGLVLPQLLVGFVVVFFYLLDCLFTERRDRSILFWKSLPVSDTKTVLSKLFVALVAVPLWIWALSLVVGLSVFGVVAATVLGTPFAGLGAWHGGTWLAVQASMLGKMAIAALWYLPVAGWLLLVSVLAKRAPFVWATLPFLVLSIAERNAIGTQWIGSLVARRLFGFGEEISFSVTRSTTDATGVGEAISRSQSMTTEFPLLTSPELWFGALVGAGLVCAAIRLRRRSDDS